MNWHRARMVMTDNGDGTTLVESFEEGATDADVSAVLPFSLEAVGAMGFDILVADTDAGRAILDGAVFIPGEAP